ncbi:hypothetical protein [Paenalcaligenes faecalis]|uniref:hypothetical protein n=1 Tax=Paenalcaligenes faecalis TaxID=2980099 RepID=UPI0022B98D79|nr:hypothetical protein [Paenalcaligenes faecalis]
MSAKHLQDLYVEAVRLGALLRTLHNALPDDTASSGLDTRFIVGWGVTLAEGLASDLDALDVRASIARLEAVGGTHE